MSENFRFSLCAQLVHGKCDILKRMSMCLRTFRTSISNVPKSPHTQNTCKLKFEIHDSHCESAFQSNNSRRHNKDTKIHHHVFATQSSVLFAQLLPISYMTAVGTSQQSQVTDLCITLIFSGNVEFDCQVRQARLVMTSSVERHFCQHSSNGGILFV